MTIKLFFQVKSGKKIGKRNIAHRDIKH